MSKTKQSFFDRIVGSGETNENKTSMPVFSREEESEMIMNTSPAKNDDWSGDSEGQLTIDVYQTENEIVVKSTIAGVKPEDLDVAINNDMVTIKGERKNEEIVSSDNYYYQECYWGQFSRSVVLPVDIISEKAEASLKNGILTIRLPKAASNKVKKIQVRGF
jgi:HSP20 family protein